MSFRSFVALALLGTASLVSACNDDGKPCDPDQMLKNRTCFDIPVEAGSMDVGGGGTDEDAETPDGEIADIATTDEGGGGSVFGRNCVMSGNDPECVAPAPYCAVQPGATTGYCTTLGCKADMSLCPPGWTCFVIASINLDFCLKP
jgi:hypothetical protein